MPLQSLYNQERNHFLTSSYATIAQYKLDTSYDHSSSQRNAKEKSILSWHRTVLNEILGPRDDLIVAIFANLFPSKYDPAVK